MKYLHDEKFLYQFLYKHLGTYGREVLDYACEKHKNQIRAEGIPYIVHPMFMAYHAMQLGVVNEGFLNILLLHDVLEDCDVKREKNETREEAKKRYFDKMKMDSFAIVAKGFDRYHNLISMSGVLSVKRQKRYIEETKTYILPLLEYVRDVYQLDEKIINILLIQIYAVIETIEACWEEKEKENE